MVRHVLSPPFSMQLLSVLALSSRFDGPASMYPVSMVIVAFSTRSVESF